MPTRTCDTRAEGPAPPRRFSRPGDVRMGPVAFAGLKQAADRENFEQGYNPGSRRYMVKAGLLVRAGRVVTVSIAPAHRSVAGLDYVERSGLAGVPAVRFRACDKDEPAFSYDGPVGLATAFPGGFVLARPACVRVTVRVRGRRTAYRRTVRFGVRRCA